MIKYSRIALLICADAICINLAYIIALLLRFEFDVELASFNSFLTAYIDNAVIITVIKLVVFWAVGIYRSLWKYAGSEELIKVALAAFGALAAVSLYLSFSGVTIPRGVQGICFLLDIIMIGGVRFLFRAIRNFRHPGNFNLSWGNLKKNGLVFDNENINKVMIVGAGDAGAGMIKEIRKHPEYGRKVVVAVDDNKAKAGQRIVGVRIAGSSSDIKRLARKYGISEIIIAIPTANKKQLQKIINECSKTRCKIKTLPAMIDLINEKVSISKLRDVDIEDLLGRDPVQVNLREISGYIEGKIVMITGGGGSIGSELCRQIARFRPRKLIAVDIYENTLFEVANEVKDKYPQLEFEAVVASVRSKHRMEEVFLKYKPHLLFHAAAHKHVPLMEKNPKEAIINNILGTKNLIDLSDAYAVEKFVLISTDKAVNPSNVMGATKRVAEMMLQDKSEKSRTSYSAVRFGNVLGSNGSVLPIFRRQIADGGPVTVTHPDITRYFMTIPEAVQLVIQAGAMAEGGEIFILDMGEPVRIMDLAENVIRLSGYVPYVDIDIKVTGLRTGEKLYEELLLEEEGIQKTTHNKIYVGQPVPPTPTLAAILEKEDGVAESVDGVCSMSDEEARQWLHRMVPNYKENGKS